MVLGALISFAWLASASSLRADLLISVDFNSSGGPNPAWGTYTGSGVLGGGTWNGITVPFVGAGGSSLATTSLVDSSNTASGASIAITPFWTSFNLDAVTAGNINATFQPLMADYLYLAETATNATVTLSGLGAATEWDIVLYAAQSTDHGSAFTIDGVTKSTTDPGAIGATLVDGQQYVRFNNISSDGSGSLTIDWAKINTFSALNGLQLMESAPPPVPEPGTWAVGAGLFALAVGARLRRRRK